jgi:hypothetical protein
MVSPTSLDRLCRHTVTARNVFVIDSGSRVAAIPFSPLLLIQVYSKSRGLQSDGRNEPATWSNGQYG